MSGYFKITKDIVPVRGPCPMVDMVKKVYKKVAIESSQISMKSIKDRTVDMFPMAFFYAGAAFLTWDYFNQK